MGNGVRDESFTAAAIHRYERLINPPLIVGPAMDRLLELRLKKHLSLGGLDRREAASLRILEQPFARPRVKVLGK